MLWCELLWKKPNFERLLLSLHVKLCFARQVIAFKAFDNPLTRGQNLKVLVFESKSREYIWFVMLSLIDNLSNNLSSVKCDFGAKLSTHHVFKTPVWNARNWMDNLPDRLKVELADLLYTTARKRILKLVELQSFVAKFQIFSYICIIPA